MIPKIIHYCWFGKNPLPELAQKCIASWRRYCPDYQIICWDETNFDVSYNDYVQEAYQAQKWAFITDVARLFVLYTYGGIYMDTDVEVLKPLDDLLGFEAVSGFESEHDIPTGLMASQKGFPFFERLLRDYDSAHFIRPDGTFNMITNVERITQICLKYGFLQNNQQQTIEGFTLFPKEYFCPKEYSTGVVNVTEHTYTIHHFDGSWLREFERLAIEWKRRFPWIPQRAVRVSAIVWCEGLPGLYHETCAWISRKSTHKIIKSEGGRN